VIYSREPFTGQMFDLAAPDFTRMTVIYVDQPISKGGDTLRVADIDGDGIDDLLYGAPDYDPLGYDLVPRRNAGLLAVIFGEAGGLPNINGQMILPSQQPANARIRYIVGADENDMMAYALAVSDVDGDGIIDIAPNAMGGDGAANSMPNAGEIYVISGAEFLSPTHVQAALTPTETPTPAVENTLTPIVEMTPTPTQAATPTPFPTLVVLGSGDAERGRRYYDQACLGCHGPAGMGGGVGPALVNSPFVLEASDIELLEFLRVGRSADAPESTTGVTMPAYGGRVDWGDAEMLDIIAYLRELIAANSE
jgi:mono/diheme cytochrome c family protein